MAWRDNLQQASFRGIPFDVKDIDDSNTKALVLHQYAYKDGADIEDLGNDAEEVSLNAVFWGDDYEANFNRLLDALAKKDKGTLVHPIRGRMPNMIASMYHFTHEAENIDYVRFNITFKKSNEEDPLFSLMSVFSVIDDLFNRADALIELASDYFSAFMSSINKVKSYRARVRGINATLQTLGYEIDRLILGNENGAVMFQENDGIQLDKKYDAYSLLTQVEAYFSITKVKNTALPYTEINSLKTAVETLDKLPGKIAQGESRLELGVPIVHKDIVEVQIVLRLVLNSVYLKEITSIIENDDLTPLDIEQIVNHARSLTQQTLANIRDLNASESDKSYQIMRELRDIQHQLKVMAMSYIAKRPPLLVRRVPVSATLHQVAFMFYQDHSRFNELLQLNPQIIHPNFIKEGALLNAYAE